MLELLNQMDGFQPNSMIKVAVVALFHWMFVAGLLGGWREDMEKQSGFNVHLKLEQKSMISSLHFYQIRHSRMMIFPFQSPPCSNGIDVPLFWIRVNETWWIKCAHCTPPRTYSICDCCVYTFHRLCRHYGIHALLRFPLYDLWQETEALLELKTVIYRSNQELCALVWRTAMPQSVLIVLQFTARHASIINI